MSHTEASEKGKEGEEQSGSPVPHESLSQEPRRQASVYDAVAGMLLWRTQDNTLPSDRDHRPHWEQWLHDP
jgi:hypothetical protein